ncbi:MAG: biotin--[acetyl-CoA-carboxylase] ligase [Candidatus Omnitrophica bacterium]|nr:biotin--[acetyl-CoA-carboxylase] ligase [Candidatus Omnitrophota bacterium]
MQEKILDFLRKEDGYFSGDQLSHKLGITRQALWKHIQELRDAGYEIVAVPHLGYRLDSAPDRLFAAEVLSGLKTKFFGRKIYYYDALSSTMDVAVELGMKSAADGALIIAETQTKGRGRLGRIWFSPKHKGIYLSIILRPKILPNQASLLTLLAAVSICEAVKDACNLDLQIKWPNDLLIGNKKIGGILTELNAEIDKVNFVVIGLGLNVNNDLKALVSQATSLKEEKKEEVNRVKLLQEILLKMEENYLLLQDKGRGKILEKWRHYNITLGRRIKVYCQKQHIEGDAVDIDTDGGLLVRRDTGVIERVLSGDVVHCR